MISLSQPGADIQTLLEVVPHVASLQRCRTIGIGAHQDDLEFSMYYPILRAYDSGYTFGGIIMTNGAGAPRAPSYEEFSEDEYVAVRRNEQRTAAMVGKYSAMIQLDHASSQVRNMKNTSPADDLEKILRIAQPEEIYTHDLGDRHPTHLAVLHRVVEAICRLPIEMRPKKLIGCEGWRGLDWLAVKDRIIMDVSHGDDLARRLINCFHSQTTAKSYTLAVTGRRRANATFLDPHILDSATSVIFGVDMTELIGEKPLHPLMLFERYCKKGCEEQANRLAG